MQNFLTTPSLDQKKKITTTPSPTPPPSLDEKSKI